MSAGSAGRTRTCDKVVNSHLLYQLSYRGTVGHDVLVQAPEDLVDLRVARHAEVLVGQAGTQPLQALLPVSDT